MCINSRHLYIFGILSLISPDITASSDEVTSADIAECGSSLFGRMTCTSINFYRECIVPGAETITAIKVHKNLTENLCVFKDTFGYRSNAVWVARGCSAEFYLCFTGDLLTTYTTDQTVSTGRIPPDIDVVGASSSPDSNKVVIYIIIGVVILILVCGGLILGCIVKQRQQREKSRRIAAKRQVRIDQGREKREKLEGNLLYPVALSNSSTFSPVTSNRSFSVDFADTYDNAEDEREGSICSSRSTNSGLTSVSCMTTGRIMMQSYSKRFSLDQNLHKGLSTPDIRVLPEVDSEIDILSPRRNRQTGNNISGSQTSLESIREICNRYKVYEIPLERRLSKQTPYKRPTKYNTIGFSGPCLEKAVRNGGTAFAVRQETVTALVHAENVDTSTTDTENQKIEHDIDAAKNAPFESHYQDPQSLLEASPASTDTKNYPTDGTPWSSIDEGIQKDMTDGHDDTNTELQTLEHCPPIYATVNKRNKGITFSTEKYLGKNGTEPGNGKKEAGKTKPYSIVIEVSQRDDSDRNLRTDKSMDSHHYAHLESFKPSE